jgi:hypothetical protein
LEDAFINLLSIVDTKQNRIAEKSRLSRSPEIISKNDAVSTINGYLADLYSYNEPTD